MTESMVAPRKSTEVLRLAGQALLLDDSAYATVYDAKHPLRRGFTILLVILLTVGVAMAIGLALDIVVTPRLDLVETAVFEALTETTWYQDSSTQSPDFATSFKRRYTVAWQIAYAVGQAPSWLGTLTGFLVTLIVSLLGWFIYGSLAYRVGRWLGGQGNYQQFMGTMALAYAPVTPTRGNGDTRHDLGWNCCFVAVTHEVSGG